MLIGVLVAADERYSFFGFGGIFILNVYLAIGGAVVTLAGIVLKTIANVLAPVPVPPTDMGQDPLMRAILPVGRSGWAIAAGYLGLFSVLLVFAPFALLTGVLAVVDIRRHPKRHGMGRAVFGIVMGLLFTPVLLLLLRNTFRVQ